MQKLPLSEAYIRRTQIQATGQRIYFKGDDDDDFFEIAFVEKPGRRPGWYQVTMKQDDGYSTSFSLPGQVVVIVK